MWEYRPTEELYHARHKYIKRVWKNGRWVYTYDIKSAANDVKNKVKNALGVTAKADMVKAQRNVAVAKRDLGYSKHYQQHVDRKLAPYMEGRNRRSDNISSKDAKFQKSFEKRFSWDKLNAEQEVTDAKKKVTEARKVAEAAVKKYESTPIGKLETAAKKGKELANKLISKLFGKKTESKKTSTKTVAEEQARNEKRMAEVRAENKRKEKERKKYIERTRNYKNGPNPGSRSRQYKK